MPCVNCGATALWIFETAGISPVPYCGTCVPRVYLGTRYLTPAEVPGAVVTEEASMSIEADGLNILVEVQGTGGLVMARFGDDTHGESDNGMISHTYASPGTYRVSVATSSGSISEEITVVADEPVAPEPESTEGESGEETPEDDPDPDNPGA